MSNKSIVVSQREVRSTDNYDTFKIMNGNRAVNENHVKQLQSLMLSNGNLTYEFPIVVDKDNYVIDGQHRLEALKGLGWEIAYIVEESATIETVRSINLGNRNWTWEDLASSYASRGNENYTWFLNYTSHNGLKLTPAFLLISDTPRSTTNRLFERGELSIEDKGRIYDITNQFLEIRRMTELYNNDFARAFIKIMRSSAYDHARMVKKMREQGETLPTKARINDYLRAIEDIFNYGYAAENRRRLF